MTGQYLCHLGGSRSLKVLNYVLKLFTVTENVAVGIFMAVIPIVPHYAVDCAWVTVS